jgi:hypothetical protein
VEVTDDELVLDGYVKLDVDERRVIGEVLDGTWWNR